MHTCNDCSVTMDDAITLFPEWITLCGECYRVRFNLAQVNVEIPDNPTNWRAMFPNSTIALPGDKPQTLPLWAA